MLASDSHDSHVSQNHLPLASSSVIGKLKAILSRAEVHTGGGLLLAQAESTPGGQSRGPGHPGAAATPNAQRQLVGCAGTVLAQGEGGSGGTATARTNHEP